MRIMSVDPGEKGAITIIDEEFIDIVDMPVIVWQEKTGKKKRRVLVDGEAISDIICDADPDIVVVEDVGSMGASDHNKLGSVAKLVFGYGIVVGAAMARGRSVHLVRPAVWKKDLGLTGRSKEGSHALCLKLLPESKNFLFGPRGGKKIDRAESCLIALYYARKHKVW